MGGIRPSSLAGSWYPADPGRLSSLVDGWIAAQGGLAPPEGGRVVAGIVPHAGYEYSGTVATEVYRRLRRDEVRRVVIAGPSHYEPLRGWATCSWEAFETPLGRVPVDREAVAALAGHPLATIDDSAHHPEHGIEIQLPILQRVLGDFLLVPVVVGELPPGGSAALAEAVRPFLGPDTVYLASSDFTHYGQRFGYEPFAGGPGQEVAQRLRELDLGLAGAVLALDADRYERYLEDTGITACGHRPMAALIHELTQARAQGRRIAGELLRYASSGDKTGDFSERCVSYVAAMFVEAGDRGLEPGGQRNTSVYGDIDHDEARRLLGLARWAIRQRLATGEAPKKLPDDWESSPRLASLRGAFVTLRRAGQLRGCIGTIEAVQPLEGAVLHNAVRAGFHDPRFPPLEPEEEPELHLDISILSPLEEIESVGDIEIGRHGLQLEWRGHSGILLPQVAVEFGLDAVGFLDALCRKSGIAPGAWRAPDCRVWRFAAQVIEE